jgi:hypothetical protein
MLRNKDAAIGLALEFKPRAYGDDASSRFRHGPVAAIR